MRKNVEYVPLPPEKTVELCHRYGVPLDELHKINKWWRRMLTTKATTTYPRHDPKLWKPWLASISPKLARYPYPPGVERGSPEWCRLRDARKIARRRATRTRTRPFIEGYDDLATYVPKRSTKAP